MNIFEKAKTTKTTKTTASKKNKKKEVKIDGLKQLASLKAVEKALKAMIATVEEDVKEQTAELFVEDGIKRGARPDNFRGIDEGASASCELRKRSTRSPLNPDETSLLDDYGIDYDVEVDVEETFVINPAYANDQAILEKVAKALSKVKDLPDDFIIMQEGVSRKVVTDDTVNQIFQKKDAAVVRRLMEITCTQAVKPTLDGGIDEAMEVVRSMLVGEDD